ncbi:MAG: hypothetical protein AAB794_04540 [Patescibacteria group bacterium]
METIQKYFFAGAAAALALVFVAWQIGYRTGLESTPTIQATQAQLLSDGKSIFGKIIDISGATLTIATLDSALPIRKVIIDSETVLGRLVPKDQKVYQSEITDFNGKIDTEKSSTALLQFPSPFASETISLTNLRVGDIVTVTAADTILLESTFTATRVSVQSPP